MRLIQMCIKFSGKFSKTVVGIAVNQTPHLHGFTPPIGRRQVWITLHETVIEIRHQFLRSQGDESRFRIRRVVQLTKCGEVDAVFEDCLPEPVKMVRARVLVKV